MPLLAHFLRQAKPPRSRFDESKRLSGRDVPHGTVDFWSQLCQFCHIKNISRAMTSLWYVLHPAVCGRSAKRLKTVFEFRRLRT